VWRFFLKPEGLDLSGRKRDIYLCRRKTSPDTYNGLNIVEYSD
jgi:hypothetical protein